MLKLFKNQTADGGKDGEERERMRGSNTDGKRDVSETKRHDASDVD